MQIDSDIEKRIIEKLIEKEYSQKLINQIIKAYEKGYDLSTISKSVNIDKLRNVIKELPELPELDNKATLNIFIKMYGGTERVLKKQSLRPEIQNIILTGLNAGVNPNAYKYIGASGYDAKYITDIGMSCLKINKDIYEYMEKGYDTGQISVLVAAWSKGLNNIEKYVNPTIEFKEMGAIYKLLEFYHVHRIKEDELFQNLLNLHLKRKVMEKIIDCLEEGVDISIIFNEKVEKHQIPILLTASRKGYDQTPLLDSRLSTDQMNVIMTGLEFGLDVYKYNNPAYNVNKMNLIFKTLKYNKDKENKIDLTPILNPKIPLPVMCDYIYAVKVKNEFLYKRAMEELNEYNKKSKER